MSKVDTRYPELDLWRGLAITGMVIFHLFYALNFFEIHNIPIREGGWKLFARLVQWSFLLLVGIGLQLSFQRMMAKGLSKHQFMFHILKRSGVVLCCAAVISIVTFFTLGTFYVRFGILHMIGTSLLVLAPLVNHPKTAALLSAVIYFITPVITAFEFPESPLLIFGIRYPEFASLDFFPLFPWLAIPALGLSLGSLMFTRGKRSYPPVDIAGSNVLSPLRSMGRKSLLIYMVHVPILLVIISIIWGEA